MAISSSSIPTAPADGYATHEVLNQPGSLADYNAFTTDRPLTEAVRASARTGLGKSSGAQALLSVRRRASNSPGRPIAICPSCAPTTASAIGSIRSSSTPPIMS